MRVKVFQGFGEAGVQKIEDSVNRWLEGPSNANLTVVRTDIAAASVGPSDDRYQTVVAMIWYEVAAKPQ